jgi:hypothetical protein
MNCEDEHNMKCNLHRFLSSFFSAGVILKCCLVTKVVIDLDDARRCRKRYKKGKDVLIQAPVIWVILAFFHGRIVGPHRMRLEWNRWGRGAKTVDGED